jgi:cytidyltransferase-like protein
MFIKYLNNLNIDNFKKYKYCSEDNCFLTPYYYKLWSYLGNFIPRKIHPNFITLFGLFIIFLTYNLSNIFTSVSNIIMGIGVIGYVMADGLDGIHARNTRQTSIIGEYLDHLVDQTVLGIILTYIFTMFGLDNIFYNNLYMLIASFEFSKEHYNAISTKKIIFYGSSDVSLITTLTYLIIFLNQKLPDFLIKNQWILLASGLVYLLVNVNNIIKNNQSTIHSQEKDFKQIYLLYWLLKFILSTINQSSLYWSCTIVDLLVVLETINLKIFGSYLLNKYLLFALAIVHIYSPVISNLIVPVYLSYFFYSISTQLNINLIHNPPSVYLPRVYCCGVFDMCHLGHMKLFEKISKSFGHPIWLIVGVHSDPTVKSYKRESIINEKFRIETVSLCKYVDEVYPDAKLIVTKEFCLENKIDCVIIGEEYKDTKDKIWYIGPMELGIHKYISRFEELSTTDIISKVKKLE